MTQVLKAKGSGAAAALSICSYLLQGPRPNSSELPHPVSGPPRGHSIRGQLQDPTYMWNLKGLNSQNQKTAEASGNGSPSLCPTVGERSTAAPSEHLRWSPGITLVWYGCPHSVTHLCILEPGPVPRKGVQRVKII